MRASMTVRNTRLPWPLRPVVGGGVASQALASSRKAPRARPLSGSAVSDKRGELSGD